MVLTSSVSWPHDPTRPCRPEAGFGLVIMMMTFPSKDEERLYLIMEFLPGGDLMTLLMKKVVEISCMIVYCSLNLEN